jgi:hypothetical protein
MLASVPAVLLLMVTRLPSIPEIAHEVVIVCVVAIVNVNVVGCTPLARIENVLLPEIVRAPAPSLDRVQL